MLPKSVTNRRASDLTKRGAELTKRTGELTKDVAVFTMQAVVRAKAAQRELARLRTARAVEQSHEQMSGVLARPAHAPSLLSGGSTREKSPQLLEAVRLGDLPTAQALLSRRADPDSRDGHGLGALHIACAHSQPALLSLLLEAGADI